MLLRTAESYLAEQDIGGASVPITVPIKLAEKPLDSIFKDDVLQEMERHRESEAEDVRNMFTGIPTSQPEPVSESSDEWSSDEETE